MRREHFRAIFRLSITVVLFAFGGNGLYAQPQTSPGGQASAPSGGGGGADSGTAKLVAGYGTSYRGKPLKECIDGKHHCNYNLFSLSPSYDASLFSGTYLYSFGQDLLKPSFPNGTGEMTADGIHTLVAATPTNLNTTLLSMFASPSIFDDSGEAYSLDSSKKLQHEDVTKEIKASQIADLNLQSLVGTVQYEKGENQKNAGQFIKYVSTQFSPRAVIDLSLVAQQGKLEEALTTPKVQQYLAAIRQLVATYSVGISNLNYLYNERVPVKIDNNLDSYASVLPKEMQDKGEASPLAIDQWMATRRLMTSRKVDKKKWWVNRMEKATPATLQREMVSLLAEIRYELYKNRMVNERLLAAASVNGIQNATTGATLRISGLQRAICQISPLKDVIGACPPQPSIGG